MKERPIHLVLLEEELKRRKRVNARFSLRTFAKMIGADPSHLSKILQCDKPLTPNIAKRFIEKSELSETEKSLFWDSFIREREKSFGDKNIGLEDIIAQRTSPNENSPLSNETFYVISEPYHWAIVEMANNPVYGNDPEKIAQKIGYSVVEVTSAIQRLVRCGFLKKTEGGVEPVKSTWELSQGDAVSNTAQTLHQKRVMEKAAIALDRVPSDSQAQSAMTLVVDASKMIIAQQKIQNFMTQLSQELNSASGEVYQLSLSLFPVAGTYGQISMQLNLDDTTGSPAPAAQGSDQTAAS
jgi:uncharacterized protein (TIGR02147 family)